MKFEEKNAKRYKREQRGKDYGYIYFLMDKDEVVYVGQTKVGISRPLSHINKEYDSFYMKKCKLSVLDKRETEMILKYKPIYNGNFINTKGLVGLSNLKEELRSNGYDIRIVFLQREIDKLGINLFCAGQSKSITEADAKKLKKHIIKNYNTIQEEQELSLKQVIISEKDDYGFCLFLTDRVKYMNCNWVGAKTVKDLYYFGKLSNEEIAGWWEEYKRLPKPKPIWRKKSGKNVKNRKK